MVLNLYLPPSSLMFMRCIARANSSASSKPSLSTSDSFQILPRTLLGSFDLIISPKNKYLEVSVTDTLKLPYFWPRPQTPSHLWDWGCRISSHICICPCWWPTPPRPPPRWSPLPLWTWRVSWSPSPGQRHRPAIVSCLESDHITESHLYLVGIILSPDLLVKGNHCHQLCDILCQHPDTNMPFIQCPEKIDLLVHPLEQLLVHEVELGEVLVCELLLHLGDIWEVARTDLVLPLQLGVSEMSKLLNLKISKSSKHLQSVQVFDQFFLLPLLPEHGRHVFLQAGDYVGVHLKYELDRILKKNKILNQEIIFHHIKCESLMFNPQIQLLSPLRNQCQCHLPWRVSLSWSGRSASSEPRSSGEIGGRQTGPALPPQTAAD